MLTLVSAMAATTVSASARGNHTDTPFSFTVSNSAKATDYRQKLDDTSGSIKVSTGSSVVVHMNGSTSSLNNHTLNSGSDCTAGTPKVVTVSSAYTYLPNYVKENGYAYAKLLLTSATGTSFASTGLWSPDSI